MRNRIAAVIVLATLGLQPDAGAQDEAANRADGRAFLEQNAEREGVVSLPSGLQYEVLAEGDGATPGRRSTVVVHFHGTNVSGERQRPGTIVPWSTSGSGPQAKPKAAAVGHYRGTLIDGTEFDSSHKRGEPAKFRVNQVISGWTEALQRMRAGDKWKLYLPPDLAYGDRGAGPLIAPGSTLIFEVELLEVR